MQLKTFIKIKKTLLLNKFLSIKNKNISKYFSLSNQKNEMKNFKNNVYKELLKLKLNLNK